MVSCDLKRAPDVKDAVEGALVINPKIDKVPAKLLLSLRELLRYDWRARMAQKRCFYRCSASNNSPCALRRILAQFAVSTLDLINHCAV